MKNLVLLSALSLLCCSCAFMSPRNRPLMNLCERNLVPESPTARYTLLPLYGPVCLLAGGVDTVAIHPALSLEQSVYDIDQALWQPTGRGYVTECALVPLRAAATPPLWVLYFVPRCLFITPVHPPSPSALEGKLLNPDPSLRMAVIKDIKPDSYAGDGDGPATSALLKAVRTYPDDAKFCDAAISRLPGPLSDDTAAALAQYAQEKDGPLAAAAIERLFLDSLYFAGYGIQPDPRLSARAQRAAERLARLYDTLVEQGRHKSEVHLLFLCATYANRPYVQPQGLGLYLLRSLHARHWPAYAQAAAFFAQHQLLGGTEGARIDALANQWAALRVSRDWPLVVNEALAQKQASPADLNALRKKQSPLAQLLPRTPDDRERLVAQQQRLAQAASVTEPGQPLKVFALAESMIGINTALDADQVAERLLQGPPADLQLFRDTISGHLREKIRQ